MYCSPLNEKKYKNKTCYSYDDLKNIAIQFNKLNNDKINIEESKSKLYQNIKLKLKDVCATEFCWGKKYLSNNKIKTIFKPEKPITWYTNKTEWLNTNDINYVMSQYELLYKNFKYMGTFPMDFQEKINNTCIGNLLCDISFIKKYNIKRFATILNLDYSNQNGSHWVALYCDLRKNKNYGMYYYDSTAFKYTKEVKSFYNKIKKDILNNDTNFKLKHNKIKKQYKNSECGMFSIIFLIKSLKDIPFKIICESMPNDDAVNTLRDSIYIPSLKL